MVAELRRIVPDVRPFGLGSQEMRGAGVETLTDSAEISVVGITEVLKVLGRAREIFKQLLEEVDRRRAEVAVLIDFPEFNMRLAKALHRRGVKVVYYISPQVWAWRRYRTRALARHVARLLVVLPFELDFFGRHGVEAEYVGNPLVDEVPLLPQVWDEADGPGPNRPFVVSLLPGSRRSEVESLLPVMVGAGRLLASRLDVRFRLIKAPPVPAELFSEVLTSGGLDVELVEERRFEAIAASHLAICAAGTATLEVGLLGTPQLVIHKVQPLSAMLGRWLLDLDHVSLVNLVLGESVVPELLQERATPEEIAAESGSLLQDRGRIRAMRSSLALLREQLGASGASRRAAEAVASAGWDVTAPPPGELAAEDLESEDLES